MRKMYTKPEITLAVVLEKDVLTSSPSITKDNWGDDKFGQINNDGYLA